jgi:hypothetical protein
MRSSDEDSKVKLVDNSVCAKIGCYRSAKVRLNFPFGFSALFCEGCASELVRDRLGSNRGALK